MLRTAGPMTKVAAERLIAQEGYPEQFDTGECGDGGYGSRLYFRKGPDAPTNEFGWPLEHATLSRLGGYWHAAIFEGTSQ
jgi:hypothetical protein